MKKFRATRGDIFMIQEIDKVLVGGSMLLRWRTGVMFRVRARGTEYNHQYY